MQLLFKAREKAIGERQVVGNALLSNYMQARPSPKSNHPPLHDSLPR